MDNSKKFCGDKLPVLSKIYLDFNLILKNEYTDRKEIFKLMKND